MGYLAHQSELRPLPVCLRDVKLSVRCRAAADVAEAEGDGGFYLRIALFPSDRIYWVQASAADRLRNVLQVAA